MCAGSRPRVAEDVGAYYQLARYGEPGDYAGPDLLAEWYRRNVRIYNNVMKLVTTPDERVLVIFPSVTPGTGMPVGVREVLVTAGFFALFVLSRRWFLGRYRPNV